MAKLLLGPELVHLHVAVVRAVEHRVAKVSNPEIHLHVSFHSQGWLDTFIQPDKLLV